MKLGFHELIDRGFFAAGGSSLNALLFVAKLHEISFDDLTVERLINVKILHEILTNRSDIERSHGLLFNDHDDSQYRIVPLDQVDKHEAIQMITESFTVKSEFHVLLHHHCPELKLEYKRDWFVFLNYYWTHFVQSGLSFCLLKNDGRLIDISLSDDLSDELDFDLTTIPRLTPIFRMIDAVEHKLFEQLHSSNIHLQSIMHNVINAVSLDVELALSKRYQAVLLANNNDATQQIAEYAIKYDYNFIIRANEYYDSSGIPVFPNVLDEHKMIVSIKLLT